MLKGKNIVLGVTGGIAAYKACDIASRLVKMGADVHVIMTKSACEFVTPLTFKTLTNNKVYTSVFDENDVGVPHIDLAQGADVLLVAPATANFIGKAANGIADDMLTSTVLAASNKKIIISPAMNSHMYENPAVQENIKTLISRGFVVIKPDSGRLACGDTGIGKLPDSADIVERVAMEVAFEKCLLGKRVLITAGATQEAIDPVRYITNHSTGKMGYALARVAKAKGAHVTLITGKTSLKAPLGVDVVEIVSAKDMFREVTERYFDTDIVIKAAAVADFKPKNVSDQKTKKENAKLSVELEKTEDILAYLGQKKAHQVLVGFCMETENLLENAEKKLKSKNLDMICANSLTTPGAGFGVDTNVLTLIEKDGTKTALPMDTKENLAAVILEKLAQIN
ncbi:MAG: bifunctional phosphopantothenoylcysteine decarboxylase/phosphopantothenate--cysteine ligase CoaBC [Clostridia bacterium]|nr:bifunctional phosphopantothenoylcysteine decarboxylase/phosphopantothenate--cysteine ligase CoaBC [Clostridia bacterium]